MIQMLLVDDHPSVMEGTRVMLEQEGNIHIVIANSGMEALDQLKNQTFDILLVDLNMPGVNGVDLVKAILNLDPNTIVLIYTGYDIEPHFNFLVEAGISGFVPKTACKRSLVTAIHCALNGETVIPASLFKELRREGSTGNSTVRGSSHISINNKELTILKNLAQGKNNKEIAEILITSQRTLEYSLTQLFHKLGVKSRKEAVAKSKQLGLLMSEDFV